MRKFLLVAVFSFVVFINQIFAKDGKGEKMGCTPTITTNALSSNTICAGSFITVNFSFTDCVFPGNIFSVELSDASGSFTTPTNIGNVSSIVAVPIDAFVPTSTTAGTNYRVRVVSLNPVAFGTDNGVNITILPKPVALFSVNNSLQCLNSNSFSFTNNSTGNIASYNWNFGDGINSSQTSPTYTYNSSGNYNVTLKAIGSNGCIDSMAKVVTVHPKPLAGFSIVKDSLCRGSLFEMTNSSSISSGTITHLWLFDDGTNSTSFNVNKSFSTSGNHQIKLITTSDKGCKDSLSKNVFVYNQPIPNFTINTIQQCLKSNLYTFQNTSTGFTLNYWNFGDGKTSSLTSPSNNYTLAGNYDVKLKVLNSNGCIDSITKTVNVISSPTAAFTHSAVGLCNSNLTVSFTNQSTGIDFTQLWNFGDGSTSTALHPSKTYAAAGTYNVKLVTTNANGCKDSITQTIFIATKPIVNFTINNASQCISNNLFSFTNQTTGAVSYVWDFADGTTSILTNPSKSYINSGIYNVKLIATHSNGCKDSNTQAIIVFEKPTASFTLPSNTICSNTLTISPTNTSTGLSNTYVWNFGDGTTSTLTNPTKTYAIAGTYNIKLVATNNHGCKDSIQQTIAISPAPIANFSINNNSQCAVNNVFSFNNSSTGAISYLWDFADGTTSILSTPNKAYITPGLYNVKLIATNINGCKDSITKTVSVLEKPSASFTLPSNSICINSLTVSPTNTSTGLNNNYTWYFGDGTTSTLANPTKTYTIQGNYIIKLIAINSNGCKDSVEQAISIATNPIANFTVNSSTLCAVNNVFTFTNISTNATSYFWDFSDGITSILSNPSKAFLNAGTYNVKLVVSSSNGCKDSLTKTVTVLEKPTAAFVLNSSATCTSSLTISPTNNSTGIGNSYIWYFGDGTTSALTNPTKTYTTIGTYTIKLVVTNGNGCKDSTEKSITFSTAPVSNFIINSSAQCGANNLFAFSNLSTGASSYFWDFGDGITSTVTNPSKSYSSSGIYTVKLIAKSVNGCADSISKTVIIGVAPIAQFTYPSFGSSSCIDNLNIPFTNNSTNANSYMWDFGDGTTSILTNPTKTYTAYGNYIVKLVATSLNGCKDSLILNLQLAAKPTASFSVNSNSQCLNNNSFIFTNSSTAGASYFWDFGDGTISTIQNPTKNYTVSGNYTVKLTVTNVSGCSATSTQTITVNNALIADFSITGYNNCALNTLLTFNNTSTGTITSASWNFGDGTTSTLNNPSKTYTTAGTYIITLKVSNGTCLDSISKTISLQAKPTAAFIVNNNSQCLSGNSFSFANQSAGSIVGYFWNFGDGSSSNLQHPIKTYTTAGNYNVSLTVTNANGCTDQSTVVVSVKGTPTINFTINSEVQCLTGNVFTFTNTSGVQPGVNYYWNFGDGLNSTLNSITKTYAFIGTYQVSLVATSGTNCKDSLVKTVYVINKPTPSFTTTVSTDCNSSTISFNNTTSTSNGINYTWYFGDGSTSTEKNPIHTYSIGGSYTIKLVAKINNGCADSITQNIFVPSKPIAAFSSNANSNPCSNVHIVNFNNTSTGSITNYLWSFGDGTTSNSIHPQKLYASAGTYVVTLTVSNLNGCTSTATQTITILPKINAAFALSSLSQCFNNNSFSFSSLANIGNNNVSYFWNLGDGTTSTASSITKSYNLPGTYLVSLTVNNITSGCSDMVSQAVIVYPKVAAILTSSGVICQGNSFVINTTLIGKPPFQLTYNNGLKDSTITNINSNIYGISVSPTTTTTYKIVSLSDANCAASIADLSNSKSVVTVQQISFTKQPKSIVACVGNNVKLSATVNTYSNSAAYQWQKNSVNILGATSDSLQINNVTIADNAVYRLAVIMPCGVVYSNEATITVEPQPAPPAFTAIVGLCQNEMANPLQASGNYLRWYNSVTGGFSSTVAPIPSTSTIGLQQYWVSNSNSTNSCESPRYLITVNVSATPTLNVVVVGNLAIQPSQTVQLTANSNAVTTIIKWFKNGVYVGPSPNNSITLHIQDTGIYVAEATNIEGCKVSSKEFFVGRRNSGGNITPTNPLVLYPNPASSIISGYFENPINENAEIRLVNMWGQILQTKTVKFTSPLQRFDFIVSNLKAGFYAIEVINQKGFSTARNLFIKAN